VPQLRVARPAVHLRVEAHEHLGGVELHVIKWGEYDQRSVEVSNAV
jgi:hypothetical protein